MFLFNFILYLASYFVPTFLAWYGYLHFSFYSRYTNILIINGAHATLCLFKPFTKSNFLHTLGQALHLFLCLAMDWITFILSWNWLCLLFLHFNPSNCPSNPCSLKRGRFDQNLKHEPLNSVCGYLDHWSGPNCLYGLWEIWNLTTFSPVNLFVKRREPLVVFFQRIDGLMLLCCPNQYAISDSQWCQIIKNIGNSKGIACFTLGFLPIYNR